MITLFKGDDTGGLLGKSVVVEISTEFDLTGCTVIFNYQGIERRWENVHDGDSREVFFSHNETLRMSLGVFKAVILAVDSSGKIRTITNSLPIKVSTNLSECYGDNVAQVTIGTTVNWEQITGKPFEGQEIDIGTDDKVLAALGTIIEKLGGTVKAGIALVALCAMSAFGYTPETHTNSFERDGVTYAQRGGLGVKDYVVTNISIKASDIGAVEDNDDYQIVKSNATTAVQPSAISDMETKTHASDTYQPKGNYLTRETDPTVPAWAKQPNPPEGMTDNALVLTNDKVQTKGGDENLGEASLGTLHVSRIYNNDLRQYGPLYIVSPWMYAFVDNLIIGSASNQNPDDEHNVIIEGTGISPFNRGSYYGFTTGRFGMIAVENWQSLSAMLDNAGPSNLAANQTFSDAVLNVGLNIDTNSVAVLNEIAETFGGFPITGTATTVGGLLAALAAAVAWLKKNKVGSFDSVGGATATVDNGVAKLDNFFTDSNSLLTGTIDARLPYPLYAVPSTGLLKDRAINTTSLDAVTVPDNFTDLLIRASVSSSLSVAMPAETTKYGDTFPGEAGEYLITITKTGAAEAYVRTIKLEEVA